ncbi:hypothetical protein HELRODRAFT_72444, partial [Helobdella robusta]|uniref:WD repeat-containing protein 13 n=1 Tax=Helobdella robusta TaxID=6412 RepID=T1G102_HELRO
MAVLALDAKYNVFRTPNNPQFRTLYLRRRSQILREKSTLDRDPTLLKEYLKIRSTLLSQRYGLPSTFDQSEDSLFKHYQHHSQQQQQQQEDINRMQEEFLERFRLDDQQPIITPTSLAGASRAMAGEQTISENYSFSGVHHIFDQHKMAGKSIDCVKFAHDDKSRLACCSLDGQISVCQLVPPPATVICLFQGHTAGVYDFSWSLSNDTILSCSADATSRLWQVSSGQCLRVIPNPNGSEVLSCLFQPANNNLFATGDARHTLQIMNLSTGKVVKGGISNLSGSVQCLCFDSSGKLLWAGDSKGYVTSFLFDLISGRLIRAKKLHISDGHSVTSICSRSWLSRECRDPSLLVNCSNNMLSLLRLVYNEGGLQIRRRLPIRQRTHNIRSTFCPIMSFRTGICVVSGSEDSTIYFFDVTKESKYCINTLQGHSGPVLDVSFAHDESLLASSDSTGVVIVWKREQR